MYKDYVVFIKISTSHFDREAKEYAADEACFMFVNRGEFSIRSQEEYLNLNRDTAVLAKCMNYFYEANEEQKKCDDTVESTGIFLYPDVLKEIFEFDFTTSNYSTNYNLKGVQVNRLLDNYKESINILLDNPELADENMIKTKLKEFVILMSKMEQAPTEADFMSALFKPAEIEFKTIIQRNLYANLSLDELAALCHLSTSSFKRKFKSVFEDSPKKYIARKKVEKAAKLLENAELRISHIAYDVGFDSLATFNRNFTNQYGKSPTDFRLTLNERHLN